MLYLCIVFIIVIRFLKWRPVLSGFFSVYHTLNIHACTSYINSMPRLISRQSQRIRLKFVFIKKIYIFLIFFASFRTSGHSKLSKQKTSVLQTGTARQFLDLFCLRRFALFFDIFLSNIFFFQNVHSSMFNIFWLFKMNVYQTYLLRKLWTIKRKIQFWKKLCFKNNNFVLKWLFF